MSKKDRNRLLKILDFLEFKMNSIRDELHEMELEHDHLEHMVYLIEDKLRIR